MRIASAFKGLLAGLAASALAAPALALSPLPPPSKLPPPADWRPPVVSVAAQAQAIQLRAVVIDTEVFAGQARSRIEMRLFNPNARVLEGELQIPLLEGQVVSGFALDVNGRLRDAVPVPKARGQEIFEDIRRRRVDPALLEATAGNQYKLRVYPIPARGERRVQLTVTETLPVLRGNAMLRIPLVFSSAVGQFQLRVHANGLAPKDVQVVQAPSGTELLPDQGGVLLRLNKEQWVAANGPAGWLQVAMRTAAAPQVMAGESAGKRFFAGHLSLADEPVRRPDPLHIALVWDASASAAAQGRVLPVLDAYFRKLRRPVQVSLLVMRNKAEPVRRFQVAPGHWDELMQALRAEPFDGSSNFDQLPIPADVDTTLLATDGLATDGKRLINYQHKAPVFAISGAAATDTPRLTRLAERTGGAMVDIGLLGVDGAVRAMQYQGWRVERITSLAADKLVAPSLYVRQGRIAVAGELADASARVDVHIVHPDGRRRVLALNADSRSDAGRWPAQQWTQWRAAALAENPALHRIELQQIAAAHGVVGPNSSLIVLELASDYAQYGLPAPAELADEVARLAQQQQAQAGQQRQAHLEVVVRLFDERQRWWERDFAQEARKSQERAVRDQAATGGGGMGELAQRKSEARPAPAGAPAAAAPMAPPGIARQKSADAVGPQSANNQATIALQAWTPDAPYMRRLQDAAAEQLYRVYLDERTQHRDSSAFYMDVASVFFERGQGELGLRVLSNLAEMNLESRQLLRLYGYRLVQAKRSDLAVPVFERISELAPNEPQSWRDLGLALAESGQHQRAVNALWEVVSRPWHGRFQGVNMIALAELNAIAAQAQADGPALDMTRVDVRLRRNMPLGLRVVLAWDTDDTDIDLWVTEPGGEKASYSNRLTRHGGAMSPDATGGYGPEEYAIKQAVPGKYVVQAQFFGHRQQVLSAGTTVMVRVTTGFGTPAAKDEWLTLRLTRGSETARIGEVEVK